MPGLTDKLFDKLLDPNQNNAVTVNDELLELLFDDSEEYRNLVKSQEQNNSIGVIENLKKLVFKLYKEKKLKDIMFFKYLAWSGQGHLCKLIGYGDKKVNEWMEEKQNQSQKWPSIDQNKHVSSANSSTDEPMETDTNQNRKPNIISNPTNAPMEAVKDRGDTYILIGIVITTLVLLLIDGTCHLSICLLKLIILYICHRKTW